MTATGSRRDLSKFAPLDWQRDADVKHAALINFYASLDTQPKRRITPIF